MAYNPHATDKVHYILDQKNDVPLSDLPEFDLEELQNTNFLDFCVGVAGYPEKHFEAPNLKKDIEYLKQKIEAGADYIVTQMFFNNNDFFKFELECRNAGIKVPIIPGIKILGSSKQLKSIPKNFYVNIPTVLSDEVDEKPDHAKEIGITWCVKQCEELLNYGIKNIHFYIMSGAAGVTEVLKKIDR